MSVISASRASKRPNGILFQQTTPKRRLDDAGVYSTAYRPLKAIKHDSISPRPAQFSKSSLAEPAKRLSKNGSRHAESTQRLDRDRKSSTTTQDEEAFSAQSLRHKQTEDFVPATHLTASAERRFLKRRKILYSRSEEDLSRQRLLSMLRVKLSESLNSFKNFGYQNPGNFCYRRSVTQSFIHVPIFAAWLEYLHACGSHRNEDSRGFRLSPVWHKLVKATQSGNRRDVVKSIEDLDVAIRRSGSGSVYDWTRNSQQADASEFVLFVVQRLLEEAQAVGPSVVKALKGIFQTQLVSEWRCQDCGEYSTGSPVDETLLSVSIASKHRDSLGQVASLQDCLDHFFVETLPGVNCERCGSRKDRRRYLKINAAPANLSIQLKRFSFAIGGSKIKTRVTYPEVLDIGKYLMDGSEGVGMTYKLVSVVAHVGSLRGGHYVTYARSSGRVYSFDDTIVSETSLRALLDPQANNSGFTPYILNYTRNT